MRGGLAGICRLRSDECRERKWFEIKRGNTILERWHIGRFTLRRLMVALAPHPTPLSILERGGSEHLSKLPAFPEFFDPCRLVRQVKRFAS